MGSFDCVVVRVADDIFAQDDPREMMHSGKRLAYTHSSAPFFQIHM